MPRGKERCAVPRGEPGLGARSRRKESSTRKLPRETVDASFQNARTKQVSSSQRHQRGGCRDERSPEVGIQQKQCFKLCDQAPVDASEAHALSTCPERGLAWGLVIVFANTALPRRSKDIWHALPPIPNHVTCDALQVPPARTTVLRNFTTSPRFGNCRTGFSMLVLYNWKTYSLHRNDAEIACWPRKRYHHIAGKALLLQ